MSFFSKKNVIALVAGVAILTGATGLYIAQASGDKGGHPPARYQQHVSPDQRAQKIADTFGVNKRELLNYFEQGTNFRDLYRAAFLAKASNQSLKQVISLKTPEKTWKDVAASLGVTPEKAKAAHQEIMATQLENKLQIAKQNSLDLMQQGYHPRDIAIANELAKNTNKPLADILGMRKINNSWHDVAQTLGVNDDTFKQDMQNIKDVFPHRGMHGGKFADKRK